MNNQMMYPYHYPQNNGITWVQGIEGAKAFQMSPSSNAILLDSDNDGIFYIKVSDNIGMCSLRIFKYEEVQNTTQQSSQLDLSDYVTKSEIADIVDRIVKEKLDEKPVVQTVKSPRKLITE